MYRRDLSRDASTLAPTTWQRIRARLFRVDPTPITKGNRSMTVGSPSTFQAFWQQLYISRAECQLDFSIHYRVNGFLRESETSHASSAYG